MMRSLALGSLFLLAVLPGTTNYKLNSYGFGSGGASATDSSNTYALQGVAGDFSATSTNTSNATANPGYVQTEQANIPQIADLDNGSGQYYNKLHFVLDPQNNPSTATFLISVSPDNFATTYYLQPDGTLSTTLNVADYQTYAAFGSATGSMIIGLTPSTNYYVRAKATSGKFTESANGPIKGPVQTAAPSITFSLVTSNQSTPPFSINLGSLTAGTITTSAQTVNTSFSTNGASGGDVYIKSQNGGLLSGTTGYKIAAISNNLATTTEGFGAQNTTVNQTSGGPFTVLSPYNGTGNVVGIVDPTTRSLYTATAPVSGGSGTLALKAKAAATDTAASDYTEVLTLIASGNY